MRHIKIRSRRHIPQCIDLKRKHEGIDGQALYFQPRKEIVGPETLADEPEVKMASAKGHILVTGVSTTQKEDKAVPRKGLLGKSKKPKETQED